MIRIATTCIAAVLLSAPLPASQKPCRDESGKVVKCPKPRAQSPRCKDATGKFVPCPDRKAQPGGR